MIETEPTDGWWTKVLTGPKGNLTDPASDEHYIVLPSLKEPRIVVDKDEPRAVQDVTDRLIRNRSKIGPAQGVVSKVLPAALGMRKRSMWRVSSGTLDHTLRGYLCDVLDTDLRISISVGPPRPNRKPVVRCYNADGLFAVAKLGPEVHTSQMVRNEARWLDIMASQPIDGIVTPPLLHSGNYGNSAILVMGALDLVSDLGVQFDEVPVDTASELCTRFAQGTQVRESEWWHGLPARMNDKSLHSVHAMMDQLAKYEHFDSVRTSAWHGDWSPWNMGWSPSGELCIWDWERTTTGVPTGMDILHLHYQYGEGLSAPDLDLDLNAMGVPIEHVNIIKRLYLYELCARHCEADALHTDRHKKVMDELAALTMIGSTR